MIRQFIFAQIKCLVTLLLFPHILPYSRTSVNGRFACRSIVIDSHHVSAGISGISRRIAFGRRGNYFSNPVAHGVVSEINSRVGLGYASYFSARSPCDAQVLVVVFYQVAYGIVLVSPSSSLML